MISGIVEATERLAWQLYHYSETKSIDFLAAAFATGRLKHTLHM